MTVTLKLKPEIEAGLTRQAKANGMTLEEYLISLVEAAVLPNAQEDSPAEEAQRRLKHGPPSIVLARRSLIMRSAAR